MPGPKLTIVVGLPGSGKTTFSRKLAKAEGLNNRYDDDFLSGHLVPPSGSTA